MLKPRSNWTCILHPVSEANRTTDWMFSAYLNLYLKANGKPDEYFALIF